MNGGDQESVLTLSTESKKYPTMEKLISLSASDMNEIVVVGGQTHDMKGVMYCLGPDGELRWSQNYPTALSSVGVSPRGTFIGIADQGQVYYFTSVGELAWTEQIRTPITKIVVSADGRFMTVAFSDGNINCYDNDIVAARKFAWKHRFDKPTSTISMTKDGTMIGAGTEEGEISIFTEKGDLVWTKLLNGRINRLRLSPDGDAVIVACSDNKLRYYSAESGRTLWTADGDGVFVDTDLTKKGERAVAICKDDLVYCYDKAGGLLWKYDLGAPGEKVVISEDGRTVAATSIDTCVHCLDGKGNLMWKFKAGGSGVSGLSVNNDGGTVVISCDAGVLFFENLQVIGGILPKIRHSITLGSEKGIPVFKAEKLYEEAVVALNYGDYQTAAQKILEIEASLGVTSKAGEPEPSPEGPPTAGAPVGPVANDDLVQTLQAEVDAILRATEELKQKGTDVEPVENLLGEAMLMLEEGNPSEAKAFINDAKEMLEDMGGTGPAPPVTPPVMDRIPPIPIPGTKEPDHKDEAMKAVEKAAKMLSDLESTEMELDAVKDDIEMARDLMGDSKFQKAISIANKAIVSMEKALDPYLTNCLVNVQKLMKVAETEGVDVEEVKDKLIETGNKMASGDYLGALDTVREAEEWLEGAVKTLKEEAEAPPLKPAITIPPPPKIDIDPPIKDEGKEEGKDEVEEVGTVTPPPRPETPTIDTDKVKASTEEPMKVLTEAEDAFDKNEIRTAVEKYIQTMEAIDRRTRVVVDVTIAQAKERVEKVEADGFEVSEAASLVESAQKELDAGAYIAAVENAMLALEKADSAAMAEINDLIEEARKALQNATALGAEIAIAEDLIKEAGAALSKGDYSVAVEFADKGVAEVEKTSNEFVIKILDQGKEFVEKAREMGADVTEVEGLFEEATKALEEKDYAQAHEGAKAAVDKAKVLPGGFVQERISEARSKVLEVEKVGADTMMAKNFLIRARSSLAAKDYSAALKACESCVEETEKAPKKLVNKRIATARSDMEAVRSMGQSTEEAEDLLSQAEAKVAEKTFGEALKLVDEALSNLKDIRERGAKATNALFDADMSIAAAAEAGKDVTKANELLSEAMDIRAKDPGRAMELAEEIKRSLEG